jgi:hypothetical protein
MIIGITGYATSGKSTIAQALCARGFTRLAFMDPLKDMLRAIGLSEEELNGQLKTKPSARLLGKTPRQAMQTLGTEWGRQMVANDLWVHLWSLRAERASTHVVCDDLRFKNESRMVRVLGGKVWRVDRLGIRPGIHASELEQAGVIPDKTIQNNGTIEDLVKKVEQELAALGL